MPGLENDIKSLDQIIFETSVELFQICELREKLQREWAFLYFCQHGRFPE